MSLMKTTITEILVMKRKNNMVIISIRKIEDMLRKVKGDIRVTLKGKVIRAKANQNAHTINQEVVVVDHLVVAPVHQTHLQDPRVLEAPAARDRTAATTLDQAAAMQSAMKPVNTSALSRRQSSSPRSN